MAKKRYRANRLRQQVTIKLPATGVDSRGQSTGTDTTVRSGVWCSIETLNGSERELAQHVFADATHRVTMRGQDITLNRKHYLTFGSRTLEIGHINDADQTNRELVLLCKEDVN